jgi:hypothetical protein
LESLLVSFLFSSPFTKLTPPQTIFRKYALHLQTEKWVIRNLLQKIALDYIEYVNVITLDTCNLTIGCRPHSNLLSSFRPFQVNSTLRSDRDTAPKINQIGVRSVEGEKSVNGCDEDDVSELKMQLARWAALYRSGCGWFVENELLMSSSLLRPRVGCIRGDLVGVILNRYFNFRIFFLLFLLNHINEFLIKIKVRRTKRRRQSQRLFLPVFSKQIQKMLR